MEHEKTIVQQEIILVSEILTVDEGQNQLKLGEAQSGSWLVEGGVKNSPFESLSTIPLYGVAAPLMVVDLAKHTGGG